MLWTNCPFKSGRVLVAGGGAAVSLCLLLTGATSPGAEKADGSQTAINWQTGPGVANFKQTAEIKLPSGYRFADGKETQRLFKAAGEPVSGREMGMLLPEKGSWSVVFEFSDSGYVKDDDKDKLDPEKLLKAIIKGNDYGNEERKKTGVPQLNIIGWEQKPAYDSATHNLEWAIRAESGERPIINYNTRLLGRKGVMEVILIVKPDALADTLPTFKELLKDYSFKSGESYAEFRQGDKLAKYGLAALITGGAVAVAAKTGLLTAILLIFKKAWKLVVVGAVAVVSFFKRLILGKGRTSPTP